MRRITSLLVTFCLLFSMVMPIAAETPKSAVTGGLAQFVSAYFPFIVGDAKANGPAWLTRTDLNLRFDSLFNPQYNVETLQPLRLSLPGQSFWQGRLGTDGVGEKPTLNLGLGHRTVWEDLPAIAGVNGFYDHSFEKGFSRLGLGLEFFMGDLEGRYNAYLPVSGATERSRTATEKTMEQAVGGYDFEFGGPLPTAPWAEVFGGGRTLHKEHSEDEFSLRLRTQMQLTPHLKVEAGYEAKPDNKYLKLRYTLGPSGHLSYTDLKQTEVKLPDLSGKLLQKVERDNIVRTETWTERLVAPIRMGVLSGYVYRAGDIVIISDSPTPPKSFEPVSGGTVTITGESGDPITVTTDASGHFIASNVPAGEATITASDGAGNTAEGTATVQAGSTEEAPSTPNPVGFAYGYAFTDSLSSLIIRPTNTAPAGYSQADGVTVSVEGYPGLQAMTNKDGSFMIGRIPAGDRMLHASVGEISVSGTVTIIADDAVGVSLGDELAAGIISGYAFVDDATGLQLKIANSTGAPAGFHIPVGAKFVLDGGYDIVVSETDGSFSDANIWPGEHTLVFDRDGNGSVRSAEIPVSMVSGGAISPTGDYVLTGSPPADGIVEGYVYTSGTDLIVQAGSTAPDGYWKVEGAEVSATGGLATTDANGHFSMTVTAGSNALTVSKSGLATASASVPVTAGATVDVTIGTPKAAVGIYGYVFSSGTAIGVRNSDHWAFTPVGLQKAASATVTVPGTGLTATSDTTGLFGLQVIPGAYTFEVTKGSLTVSGSVSAVSTNYVNIGSFPVGTIWGYAFVDSATKTQLHLDADNTKPDGYVVDGLMTVKNADGFGFPVQEGTGGRYSMEALPGEHTLYFTNPSGINYSTTVTVTEGGMVSPGDYDSPVAPTGTLQGYVFTSGTDIIVQPGATAPKGYGALADASVSVSAGSTTTDVDGHFSLSVVVGDYILTVSKETFTDASGSVSVVASTVTDVTIGAPTAAYNLTGYVITDGQKMRIVPDNGWQSIPVGVQFVAGASISLDGTPVATTDETGSFNFMAASADYTLTVTAAPYWILSKPFTPVADTALDLGDPFAVGTVTGYVFVDSATKSYVHLDLDGTPLPNYEADTTMTVMKGGFGSTVGSNGQYSFQALPGSHDITFHNSTGVNYNTNVWVTAGNPSAPSEYSVGWFQGYVYTNGAEIYSGSGMEIIVQKEATAPAGYWPVEGVSVKMGLSATPVASTDASGHFSFMVGMYGPQSGQNISVSKTGYAAAASSFTVLAGETTDVILGAPKAAYIMTGYLLTDGTQMRILPGNWWQSIPVGAQFVTGATVSLNGTPLSATTDSNGSITLTAVPASYTITATKTGYPTLSKPFTLGSSNAALDLGDPFALGTVTGYAFVNGADLHLDTDGTSGGYAPAAGMTVKDANGFGITVQANGSYSFSAVPGIQTITFNDGSGVNYTTSVTVTAGATTSPAEYPAPTHFRGYVFTSGTDLIIRGYLESLPAGYWAVSGATVSASASSTTTGADGSYDLPVLSGTYTLTAAKDGFTPVTGTPYSVTAPATVWLNIGTEKTAATIYGNLMTDGSRLFISNHQEWYLIPVGATLVSSATVDVAGTPFTRTFGSSMIDFSLVPNTYTITASKAGLTSVSGSVVVSGGTQWVSVGTPLDTGTVTGYAFVDSATKSHLHLDTNNTRPTDYEVDTTLTVKDANGFGGQVQANGQYSFQALPGTHNLRFQNGTGVYHDTSVTVTTGGTTHPADYPAMGTVQGRIAGDGLNIIVVADGQSCPFGYSWVDTASVVIGGQSGTAFMGSFTITNVPAGMQTLTASKDSFTVSGEMDVQANTTTKAPAMGTVNTWKSGTVEGYLFTDGVNLILRSSATPPPGYAPAPVGQAFAWFFERNAYTDVNGYFKADGIPEGTRTIKGMYSSLPVVAGTVNVVAGTTVTVSDFGTINNHLGSIRGYVYGDGSNLIVRASSSAPTGYAPVEGATIQVTNQTLANVTTNSSGFFAMTGILEGTQTLTASKASYSDASGPVPIEAGKTLDTADIGEANYHAAGPTGIWGYVYYRYDETTLTEIVTISPSPTPPSVEWSVYPGIYVRLDASTIPSEALSSAYVVIDPGTGFFQFAGPAAGPHTLTLDLDGWMAWSTGQIPVTYSGTPIVPGDGSEYPIHVN